MEEFRKVELETDDPKLNEKIAELNDCYFRTQRVFAKVCYKVYDIVSYCKIKKYYDVKLPGYDKKVKYKVMDILGKFGFSKKEVDRYVLCYKNFIIASNMSDAVVSPTFELFSSGKLYEMLPYSFDLLSSAIRDKYIRPEMTCKEIRETLKDLAGRTDKSVSVYEDPNATKSLEEQEEPMPEAYDPKKYHDLAYFKQFDKATLIDFLFMAEDYIKKLTKKSAKKVVD